MDYRFVCGISDNTHIDFWYVSSSNRNSLHTTDYELEDGVFLSLCHVPIRSNHFRLSSLICLTACILVGLRFIGLTGSIASGKSTVSNLLRSKGNAQVLDFDQLSRQVVRPGSVTLQNIRLIFGEEYIDATTGELDRVKLGAAVFQDERKRRVLNMIMSKPIRNQFILESLKKFFCFQVGSPKVIILDAPLLFESGLNLLCWETVAVDVKEATQVKRLQTRDGLSPEDARSRIRAQMSSKDKCARATISIPNEGTVAELEKLTFLWWTTTCKRLYLWPIWPPTLVGFLRRLMPTIPAALLSTLSLTILYLCLGVAWQARLFLAHFMVWAVDANDDHTIAAGASKLFQHS